MVRAGHLIQTSCSLVSMGTERMLAEFGNASLIAKARQQPDKVKMVLDQIRSDGLLLTLEAVFNKLPASASWLLQRGQRDGHRHLCDRVPARRRGKPLRLRGDRAVLINYPSRGEKDAIVLGKR